MNRETIIACLPYLVSIVLSVAVLRLLVFLSGARFQPARIRVLHRDETGAVQSLSFVLTLPLFVMIMLFIVQLSQLTMARLVVEYSAFAAARSAAVWIPATLGDSFETENRISALVQAGQISDQEGNLYSVYQVAPQSPKYDKIRLAAVMALMSVCPSRDSGMELDEDGQAAAWTLERTYAKLSPASASNTRIPARLRNKLAYALSNTAVEIEVRHKVEDGRRTDEPPLGIPYDIPPYRDEFAWNEIGWQDQLVVTVSHNFALLPGPGRLLSRSTPRRDGNGNTSQQDRVAAQTRRENGVFVYPVTATVRLNNEGEKSVLPYVQRLGGEPASHRPPDPIQPPPQEPNAPNQ
jgi:hypothetical protein